MIQEKNIIFINKIDLTNVQVDTQVLMLTERGKYMLGRVCLNKNTNKKYVSNDNSVKMYAVL